MKKLLSALLIATLLIASVACVLAVAEEGDNAPIATIELNSGAVYANGSSTVLAAIGENKTIEQITGYLLGGAGKDYNYFYVYAVENGVVTAEYETLGRPDGVKSDVAVPENGVLVCISVVEGTTQGLNEQINVGCTVVFENVTVEALSALEPGANIEGAKATFGAPVEDDDTTTDDGDDTTTDDGDDTTTDDGDDTTAEETTPAETTPAASSSDAPSTGDTGMIVFAVLAVVALAGGYVVVRARG